MGLAQWRAREAVIVMITAYSNTISQRVMKPLDIDVFEAARQRMRDAAQNLIGKALGIAGTSQ